MKEQLEAAKNWYFSGSIIPTMESKNFSVFAARGFSFINLVRGMAGYAGTSVEYTVDLQSPSAYYDAKKKLIALPGWYFAGEHVAKISHMDSDVNLIAIALINGSTIHEALHSVCTAKTMTEMIDMFKALYFDAFIRYGRNSIAALLNVMEDIRIESLDFGPSAKFWVNLKNEILFNDAEVAEGLAEFSGDLKAAINVAACYKRESLREEVERTLRGFPNAVKALEEILGKRSLVSACHAVAEFLKDFEADPESSSVESSGEGDSEGGGDPYEGASQAQGSSVEVAKPLTGEELRAAKKAKLEFGKVSKAEAEAREELMAKADVERAMKGLVYDKVDVVEVSKVTAHFGFRIPQIKGSERFVQELRQLRTHIAGRGRSKKTGASVDPTNIYKIATDGKVFSAKTERDTGHGNVEIIILIDASGSMRSGIYEGLPYIVPESGEMNLFSVSVAIAKKVFLAMKNAGVPSMVMAHTGDAATHERPTLIKVVSNGMAGQSTANIERQFKNLSKISLNENYDGFIIKEIANGKYFSDDQNTKKVLFVLSDGVPSGDGYGSPYAVKHTKSEIDSARRKGINVVCLSLTEYVKEQNDVIYGETHNVAAYVNLDDAMVSLIRKVATGG